VLFNLFLEKVENYLDEEIINGIILAFNHKYTYKGSNLMKSKNKLFEVIYNNEVYCDLLISNISFSANNFIDNFINFNGHINSFKESFVEFIDKLDFLVKFVEFVKNKDENILLNSSTMKILLVNTLSVKIFLELGRSLEENV